MAYIGNSPGVASQRVVTQFTATSNQTTFTPTSGYTIGYLDVFLNGVKLVSGDDYTASNGTTVVLAAGAAADDSVEVVSFIPRGLSDGWLKSEADSRYLQLGASFGGDVSGTYSAITLANSGVTAGSYGSATNIPAITVDSKGRITSVTNTAVSIPSGSLTFTGDVTGSGTTGSSTALTLANSGVTAGSYGSASAIPQVTVDSKGRVTNISTTAVTVPTTLTVAASSGLTENINLSTGQLLLEAGTGVSTGTGAGKVTIAIGQAVDTTSNVSFNNLTLAGELRGPSTLIIDPAAVGDDTGTVRVRGNLQVDGTTTTVNSTTLEVADLNITVAKNAANAAAADGAGITVAGASATLTYAAATDTWNVNKNILITPGTGNGILYLNANKVATTGSVLTFNGTTTLSVSSSLNGASNYIRVINSSNTANSGALLSIQTGGTSGGTAAIEYYNQTTAIYAGATTSYANYFVGTNPDGTTPYFAANSTGIGIGTTTPTFSTVDGYAQRGIHITGAKENGTAPVIRLSETGSGRGNWEIRSNRYGLTSGNLFQIAEATGGAFLTIRGDDDAGSTGTTGYVGIGTSSPTAKLHVTGTSGGGYQTSNKIILQRTDATLPTGSIEFQGSGGHTNPYWNILTDADVGNDFGVSYNGSKFLQILSNGNVGIGTTSPDAGAKLTVAGGILTTSNFSATTGSTAGIDYLSGNLRFFAIGTSGSTKGGYQWIAKGADNSQVTQMTLDASGRLLVNTSTATADKNGGVSPLQVRTNGTGKGILIQSVINNPNDYTYVGMQYDNGNTNNSAQVRFAIDGSDTYTRIAFLTESAGTLAERMRITSGGDILPGANGTQNFGSSSLRWNTIYTSDLSLSNGIGDWTIVEGEDDLFIYNNKRNRVYKFKLEEVDPALATTKRG